MIPTILIGLLVAVVFCAIVGRGIYNRRHGKGGCSGCGGCPGCGCCSSKAAKSSNP